MQLRRARGSLATAVPRALPALLTLVAAGAGTVFSVAATSVGASAATPGPNPGSPAYVARDVQNMEQAFGREIGPGGELTDPGYWSSLGPDMVSTELSQLESQAADPTRPALTGGSLVPGWNVGNPLRQGWAAHAGARCRSTSPQRRGRCSRATSSRRSPMLETRTPGLVSPRRTREWCS